jgi:PKD repeat protein
MKQITKVVLILMALLTATVEAAYIKVNASGNALPDSATSWSCVYDNVNELLWEVKTDDGGIHDKDNTYRWGGAAEQSLGGENYGDWDELVNGTNTETLCGQSNWGVPSIEQLRDLVARGQGSPTIDTDYFPNTKMAWFWSSSPNANHGSYAWGLSFYYGNYRNHNGRGGDRSVRLVRGGQYFGSSPLGNLSVSLTATPSSGDASLLVSFLSTVTAATTPPYRFTYDFGDGATSSHQNPSHTYTEPGAYTARVTVTDAQQQSVSTIHSISVTNPAPTAIISSVGSSSGAAPFTIVLNAQASDTNGYITNYHWDFGDGSAVESGANLSSVTHTYERQGNYSVTLAATDNHNGTGQAIFPIAVSYINQPPSASIVSSTNSGTVPLAIQFSAQASDPEGEALGYLWSFGDGTQGTGSPVSHTYEHIGTYTVRLTVTDPVGAQGGAEVEITATQFVENGIDGSQNTVSYDSTARRFPQVIAGGLSPSKVDLNDSQFDIVALVRPGVLPIDRVTFKSAVGGMFGMAMNRAGVLNNGDEIYRVTYTFQRGAFGTQVMRTAWGDSDGQYNIEVIDEGEQSSHRFPQLIFGNYPRQQADIRSAETASYISTKRTDPQVVMGGFSPTLIDLNDSSFDVIAIARPGVLPIEMVTMTQNQGFFSLQMNDAGTLDNGDQVYKMTYAFQRGAFGASTISTLWGGSPGQYNIRAIDSAQQGSHDFPDIMFGNFPAQ